MFKNLPLWARHLVLLLASIILGVFPGQFLAANTASGHRNAPALTASFFTLSVVGVIAAVVVAVTMVGYLISDGYKGR